MIIYKVTNLINNKVYVGKTSVTLEHRRNDHLSSVKANKCDFVFYRAIKKYGWENFVWEVIDQCLFAESLVELEKYYIKKLNCKLPNGYNMTDGGEGTPGHIVSEETKKKMRETHAKNGYTHSEETRLKMSIAKRGTHRTEEEKKHLSEVNLGKKLSEEHKRKIGLANIGNQGMLGKHHSEETRRKISESNRTSEKRKQNKIKLSESKRRA